MKELAHDAATQLGEKRIFHQEQRCQLEFRPPFLMEGKHLRGATPAEPTDNRSAAPKPEAE